MASILFDSVSYRASRAFSIRDLSFTVSPGALFGFLGANGAGKTTAIRLILGELSAHSGRVRVLGQDMATNAASVLARIGVVPDRPHLYSMFTFDEMIRYHRRFFSRTWSDAEAARLARQFAIDPGQRLGTLSKGQTAKAMLLLALAQCPDLLVLDEPTDGLDPVARFEVLEALVRFSQERKTTIFISSHLVHELERICTHIAILDKGAVLAKLDAREFAQSLFDVTLQGAASVTAPPFRRLTRTQIAADSVRWILCGAESEVSDWLQRQQMGAHVQPLTLERAFVEILRATRPVSDA